MEKGFKKNEKLITSSWSGVGRLSIDVRWLNWASSFSCLIPAHVRWGSANTSSVRMPAVEGCSKFLDWLVRDEGTNNMSIPWSMPFVLIFPETNVIGFAPSAFASVRFVSLRQVWSNKLSFIWNTVFSLKPKDMRLLHEEISEASHLLRCLNSSVSSTSFNTSSWKCTKHKVSISEKLKII